MQQSKRRLFAKLGLAALGSLLVLTGCHHPPHHRPPQRGPVGAPPPPSGGPAGGPGGMGGPGRPGPR